MKQPILAFLLFALTLTAYGQRTPFVPEPGEGISFNTSSLRVIGSSGQYMPSWRANTQEFQLMRESHIGLSHFGIAYGLGYSGQFYHGNLHVDVAADGTQTVQNLDGTTYEANRLATEYVDGVLELRYRSRSNSKGRYTRLYVGGIVGYLANSYAYLETADYRVKFYNIGGFNTVRYGAYAKLGRGPVNIYYYYGLNPIVTSGVLTSELGTATSQSLGISFTL